MVVEVYGFEGSSPCRFVYLVCEMLKLDFKNNKIDLMSGENEKPEFLKVKKLIQLLYHYNSILHLKFRSIHTTLCQP